MNNLLLGQLPQVGVRQNQNLLLSMAMQQAFHVLQMPIMELEHWLKNEIEQNPVLEYEDRIDEEEEKELDFDQNRPGAFEMVDQESEAPLFEEQMHELSLFAHLMVQAEMALSPEELKVAELLIGNLDERGFLSTPLSTLFSKDELSLAELVLSKVQTFDPPGVAACSLKESLLLQLCLKGKEHTLAYSLIELHFEELVHNRLPLLQKKLGCTSEELQKAIFQEIANLDLHPASRFNLDPVQPIIPDLILSKEEEEWKVEVNEEALPSFRVAPVFLDASENPSQENRFFRRQIAAARWLERILEKRRKTLQEIGAFLIKKQAAFLNGETSAPLPLMMQELTTALSLHHSTIVRAVSSKYVLCRQGLLPLRSFFTHSIQKESSAEVSSEQVKEILRALVEKEDKHSPLSDQALSKRIQREGIPVARRTVTKYRKALRIASATARKNHF
ncbi:MAG: RNA polymerase factor sigma-54 [Chlamydiales bacterium]|nr:RNA polymerase factor sigma-54 [Chlamydiales bacterium]